MRKSIARRLLTGFLPALILAGCFDLNTGEISVKSPPPPAPFSVDVGADAPPPNTLPGTAPSGGSSPSMNLINTYANFSQLVVVDGTDGSILYAKEVSRKNGEKDEVFRVPPLKADRPQLFLLLMGHKDDVEDKEESPTLLAAGFSSRPANDERKVLLYMWPIQVQPEFSSDLPQVTGKEPVTYNPVTGVFELWPADWKMKWTLTTEGEGDPLAPLIAAQEAIKGGAPSTPAEGKWEKVYPSQRLIVRDAVIKTSGERKQDAKRFWNEELSLTPTDGITKLISWDMRDYAWGSASYGNTGYVNFNLEYVPFNLTKTEEWQKWRTEITLGGGGLPVWIIRHGINDNPQDGATDFDSSPKAGANGNGAAAFKVKQRYWSALLDENGNYVGSAPDHAGWVHEGSSFPGYHNDYVMLFSVKTVWDDYKGDFLTKEEASAVVEFEVDWDKTLCVEGKPGKEFLQSVPDDLVGSLRFLRDDNNRQQRLVNVSGGLYTWMLYVKGTLRKGTKDTFEDWIGLRGGDDITFAW